MTIDSTTLESLFAWARTWTSGKPVTLVIDSDQYGRVICNVYRARVTDIINEPWRPLADFVHPVAHTQIGTL